mmetsp:Transcript_56/g.30  ORF Transcript_56/g.30 Transcript_56/m.30 type:complete len:94 (+) Transcript_56:1275-1556(+)
MNSIFATLSKTKASEASSLPNDFLSGFKICSFEEGEIVIKEVLKAGMGAKNYKAIVEGRLNSEGSPQSLPEGSPGTKPEEKQEEKKEEKKEEK